MSDSTERLGDSQGTARMDAGTARMDGDQSANSTAGGGTIFADGQALVLNGKNCVIEKLVSMGSGEAVVYKMQMDGKPFVLKHYKPNTPLSDTAKKLLAKIRDNPQERIVRIIDFGNYDGQDFEIMEYAEGGTLGEYIKKNGALRDITKLKYVAKQINEGLRKLHVNYKAIYQDLKPENIFFRDEKKSSLVLADFGISSAMPDGKEEIEVTASVTDLYGAPELARKGNNTTVEVTPAVDYFALGITLYELWLGEQPFKEIKATTRERRIQNKDLDFPLDMPGDCKTLIQGLLDPLPKDRMGNDHIQKWLKDEALAPDAVKPVAVTGTVYKPLKFGSEVATNPQEMAALMGKYPDAGKVCLYDDIITSNLKEAGNVTLYTEIKNVISQYANDQQAGLTTAIYTLDPETPFVSRKGKACRNGEEIADVIMDDSAHYMEDLKNLNASLYIYITVTGGSQGKEVAQNFCNYFKEYTPRRALTLVYLKLQGDGGIPLGSKRYLSADEIAQEKDGTQIELIKKAVREKDSPLLVWIADEYRDYFKSTKEFGKLDVTEQFFLLGLLPFLSFKELTGSNGEAALKDLIDNYPGRSDLFETYVAQGLPLKGSILDSSEKKTPIDYVVYIGLKVIIFNHPNKVHSRDIILNLIRLLHKLGADVNECSSDSTYPLQNAYEANYGDMVNLLLELGADRNKYNQLVAQRSENERIKAENERIEAERQAELQRIKAENERKEQERRAEEARIEQERKTAQEVKDQKEWVKGEKFRTLKKISKYSLFGALPVIAALWSFIIFVLYENKKMLVIEIIEDLMASGNWLDLFFDNGLIFAPIALIFFAMLHFIPTDINWFTGLLRVLSIIAIGILIICCLVFAVEIGARPVGWIGLGVVAGAFVMALVFPMFAMIGDDRAERERREAEYKDRYLKDKARRSNFKKIVAVAVASIVLLIVVIIMYNSQKNSLSIPDGVSSIEYRKYTGKQLVEVTIPDGITSIGKESFKKNKLSGIEIPASVTSIGDNAFVNNRLTTITIGANVTLGSNVFDAGFDEFYTKNGSSAGTYKHPDKRSLNWRAWSNDFWFQYNDGAISILGYNGESGTSTALVIPEEISGYPVKIIGKEAFYHKRFISVTIPNSVTTIEEEAFRGGSGEREYKDYESGGRMSFVPPRGTISTLSIGTGVTTIGNSAFEYNQLSTIVIPNNVTFIGVNAFHNNPVTSIRLGANMQFGDGGGILGPNSGFNTFYTNNGKRAGTYTRPKDDSTTWTRR
jgi:serine/threonine protein kinase